jgi:hypothetical protein
MQSLFVFLVLGTLFAVVMLVLMAVFGVFFRVGMSISHTESSGEYRSFD